jgi:hypothetical protein
MVAVVWSLGFGWATGVRLPVWVPALLALTVWTVYVADRVLDARAGLRDGDLNRLRERHLFHWRHRRIFLPFAAITACAAALLIFVLMPAAARERDSVLAVASLAYFARVHMGRRPRPFPSSLLTKELLVGVLFTLGCALPVLWRMMALPYFPFRPISEAIVFFAALAWLNCAAIDKWESHTPRSSQPGIGSLFSRACLLALASGVLALRWFDAYPRVAVLLCAGSVSALLLAWLDRRRNRLSPVTLRAAADLVLLTPAILLPLSWMTR